MESEYLPGGSGGVWRVRSPDGEIRVHRPSGAWTPAVHGLLEFLAERGLEGVPKVLGYDDEGREVLSFLPGRTLDPETEQPSIEALGKAAAWLGRFHDLVREYRPGMVEWRQGAQRLTVNEIICHNDPGVYNWVVVDNGFAGMIDWDRAGPGRPIDDLAFLCWSGVPLLRSIPDHEAAARITVAADSYGRVNPMDLLNAVETRMGLIEQRWRAGIERDDPGTIALHDSGAMDRHFMRVQDFMERRGAILALLGS